MPRRFDAGPAVALLGAAVLAVALFLRWFEPGVTAWEAFESLDLVLIGLAGAIAYGALHRDGARGQLMLLAALAAFLVVVCQLIQPPPVVDAVGGDPEIGAWLGLLGTVLALVGSVLVVAAISINVDVSGRDARARTRAVDRRAGAGTSVRVTRDDDDDDLDLDYDDDEDDDLPVAPRRAARPAPARPSAGSGSLFSRGPAREEDEDDDLDDTQARVADPQATQAFPAPRDDEAPRR